MTRGDDRRSFPTWTLHGWMPLVIQYRTTTRLLLILMTALGNVVPCACQTCDSSVCCDACDQLLPSIDCGHRHSHKHESTPGSDEAAPRQVNGSALEHDHDPMPEAPAKSCSCIRCLTVGIVWVRSNRPFNLATPFYAGLVGVSVLPATAPNAMPFGFRNDRNHISTRERALVRLQV